MSFIYCSTFRKMQLVVMSSMLRTPRGNTMLGMAFSRRLWLQSIAISSAMASTLDANAKEHCYTDSILAKTKSVRGRRCCALLPYRAPTDFRPLRHIFVHFCGLPTAFMLHLQHYQVKRKCRQRPK